MTHNKNQWIVGYGSNGYKSYGLNVIHKKLEPFLKGVNASKKDIQIVEIGDNSFYVRHENGTYFAISYYANEYCKDNYVRTGSLY